MHYHGIVLAGADLDYGGWPEALEGAGLNLLGIHSTGLTAAQQKVVDACRDRGIEVEYELHLTPKLMTPALFESRPQWFAMDILGQRDKRGNPCTSQPGALDLARQEACEYARRLPSSTHRYHFWAGDNARWCNCPGCSPYSPSDQNAILMKAMLEGVRLADPLGSLAYLAYLETLPPPLQVEPADGLFLEFAPYRRSFLEPLDAPACHANTEHRRALAALLDRFPAATAQVLEYWLDVSYFSNYAKPLRHVQPDPEHLRRDIALYRAHGINAITTFAVRMGPDYIANYGLDEVVSYGSLKGEG